jgi:hypothetical protein
MLEHLEDDVGGGQCVKSVHCLSVRISDFGVMLGAPPWHTDGSPVSSYLT